MHDFFPIRGPNFFRRGHHFFDGRKIRPTPIIPANVVHTPLPVRDNTDMCAKIGDLSDFIDDSFDEIFLPLEAILKQRRRSIEKEGDICDDFLFDLIRPLLASWGGEVW